jgi:UrcA family protein
MKMLVAIASAALLCAAADTASAQAFSEADSVRVSYADLDLTRPSGRAVLEQRIKHAIKRVCPPRPTSPEIGIYKIHRNCRAASWDGVQPQLARIYGGRHLADAAVVLQARVD